MKIIQAHNIQLSAQCRKEVINHCLSETRKIISMVINVTRSILSIMKAHFIVKILSKRLFKCFWSRRHPRLEDCPPDPRQVPAPWSWSAGPLLLLSPSVSPPPWHGGSPGPAAACSGASPGSTPGCSPARSWWDSLQFSESRVDCEKLIKMTSLTFVLISWATDVSFSLLEINSFCQS